MTVVDIRVPDDGSIVDVSGLSLGDGEVTVVFGPNGAGKTTLLRALAGIGGGQPLLDSAYLQQRPYLFRGLAGWNMGLGLDSEESAWAAQMAVSLGVDGTLARPAHLLSGGEVQRVALARTLASRRPWLLLDEPLASVDRADRQTVLGHVAAALHGRSAVVVSHDLEVAVALGDKIVVLEGGKVLQHGALQDVLRAPASVDVARVLGVQNVIPGTAESSEGLSTLKTPAIDVVGTGTVDGSARAIFPGEAVTVSVGSPQPGSARNSWRGSVVELKPIGSLIEVVVDIGHPIVAVVTPGAMGELDLSPGAEVSVAVKATAVVVIPA